MDRLLKEKECEGLQDPYPDKEYVAVCCSCRRTLLYHQDIRTHESDVEYLDSPCTEHACAKLFKIQNDASEWEQVYAKRKDCPICYAAWKGE